MYHIRSKGWNWCLSFCKPYSASRFHFWCCWPYVVPVAKFPTRGFLAPNGLLFGWITPGFTGRLLALMFPVLHLLLKYLKKHCSSIQKQITRLAFDAYWAYQAQKLSKLFWVLPPPHFNTRLWELHARWYVIGPWELTSWKLCRGSSLQTVFFGEDMQQLKIRLCSQANSWLAKKNSKK